MWERSANIPSWKSCAKSSSSTTSGNNLRGNGFQGCAGLRFQCSVNAVHQRGNTFSDAYYTLYWTRASIFYFSGHNVFRKGNNSRHWVASCWLFVRELQHEKILTPLWNLGWTIPWVHCNLVSFIYFYKKNAKINGSLCTQLICTFLVISLKFWIQCG